MISENLQWVRQDIANAAHSIGRDLQDIELIAVSKTYGVPAIEQAIAAGQHVFGENRVQEAMEKFPALKQQHPDLKLHLIGMLQTNKVKDVVSLFDVIHTLDRTSLAIKLADQMSRQNRRLPCYIQVNVGAEPQKAGVLPDQLETLLRFCRDETDLEICGLMCIPPLDQPPMPFFTALAAQAAAGDLFKLSMGMSQDYVTAIASGATAIRVGSALFGTRAP